VEAIPLEERESFEEEEVWLPLSDSFLSPPRPGVKEEVEKRLLAMFPQRCGKRGGVRNLSRLCSTSLWWNLGPAALGWEP
jgi:hypothetical protein